MFSIAKRRTIGFTVTALAIAGSVLLGSVPAWAHDQLLESSPARDEHLATAPSQVVLNFVEEIMPIGTSVSVVDEGGAEWAAGEPVLDGATVTTVLRPGMPDGAYQIRWRVVAVDGHPISDILPFTIGAEAVQTPSAATQTQTPSSASESSGANPGDAAANQDVFRTVLIGLGGAALALALLWAVRRASRRSVPVPPPGEPDESSGSVTTEK